MAQITIRELKVYPDYIILPSCKSKYEVRINQTETNNSCTQLPVYWPQPVLKKLVNFFKNPEKVDCQLYLSLIYFKRKK